MLSKAIERNWKSGIAVCSAGLVLSAVFTSVGGVKAQQEEPDATTSSPYLELQYGTVTGTANTVTATLVPVVLENGTIVYKNLTIPLKVSQTTTGTTTTVTVTAGTVTEVPSPTFQVSAFKAGPYSGPGGGKTQEITIVGPGVVVNGATEWSISQTAGATGCTYPQTATFYDGPLASNPLYARLKKAGITNSAYSYGIVGSGSTCFPGNAWYGNSIIGVAQTGNSLTIVSFTGNGTGDQNVPVDQITYTYQ